MVPSYARSADGTHASMSDEDDSDGGHRAGPGVGPATDEAAAAPTGVEDLRAALAAAREEARQNLDRWVRERADLENLKRRNAKERSDAARYGTEALIRELLPVVDNLERAVEHAQAGGSGPSLIEGVAIVLKALHDLLERHGVTRIEARGTRFDPNHHEAVAHVETAEHEPNAVVEEHQRGYRLHERLLRPALVTVAKVPSAPGNLARDGGRD
jgi:molecular chaperone GrpE